jgi:hypothetical protein
MQETARTTASELFLTHDAKVRIPENGFLSERLNDKQRTKPAQCDLFRWASDQPERKQNTQIN